MIRRVSWILGDDWLSWRCGNLANTRVGEWAAILIECRFELKQGWHSAGQGKHNHSTTTRTHIAALGKLSFHLINRLSSRTQ